MELLGDVDKIRSERRKAKANKNKYTGVGNDPMSFTSGGSRYGGFGSESLGYGGGGSGSYSGGGGGGYSGRGEYLTSSLTNFRSHAISDYDSYDSAGGSGLGSSSSSRRNFQEYDAGDDDYVPRRSNSIANASSSSHAATPQRSSTLPTPAAPEPPKAKAPVVDLLGMDDDAFGSTVSAPTEKALPALGAPATSQSLVGMCYHFFFIRLIDCL